MVRGFLLCGSSMAKEPPLPSAAVLLGAHAAFLAVGAADAVLTALFGAIDEVSGAADNNEEQYNEEDIFHSLKPYFAVR